MALPRPTHIIASQVMYYGLRSWLEQIDQFGHTVSFVETSDLAAVRNAVQPGKTGLFWIETPSNPLWTISDIAAISEIAHGAGALLCVDSTVSTPALTKPIMLGADIVIHSATKYLNGHSDVVAGALAAAHANEFWERIGDVRRQLGITPSPFDAWLLMRGMRTLDLRVREQSKTALYLAHSVRQHPAVAAVLYPGLPHHAGHDIAARQMKNGFGGMLSLQLRAGESQAIAVAARVRVFRRATSLGGVESLIEHRSSIEGKGTPCPSDLLRLSVGLEEPDDLLSDLEYALDASMSDLA
jgi:cystathionine gamma-synthase